MTRTSVAILAATAVVGLAIGGTALAAGADTTTKPLSRSVSPLTGAGSPLTGSVSPLTGAGSPTGTVSPGDDATVDRDAAAAIAANHVGGVITKIEFEIEHGLATWKITVVNNGVRYDVYVDQDTGRIVRSDRNGIDADPGRIDDVPTDRPTVGRDDGGRSRGTDDSGPGRGTDDSGPGRGTDDSGRGTDQRGRRGGDDRGTDGRG